MSQLFASPDEPRAESASNGAVKVDDAATAVPTPDASVSASVDPGPAPAPPGVAADGVFGTPPAPQPGSIDYTVPPVPPSQSRPKPPRRGAFAAGIATMALVLGTAGGVGGAAAWQQWGPSDSTPAQVATLPVAQSSSTVQPATGSVAAVAKAALPSVVQIEVKTATGGDTGSGIIIRKDGYILTNNHVIAAASNGGTVQVLFSDGQVESAKVVGATSAYDLAVIKVNRTDLKPLVLGNSSAMVVGDPVIAVGSPLGLESTVTTGIVSALNRPVTTGQGTSPSYMAAIQTDAAINPGNSGGPLLNMSGQVIGINSAIAALPGATQATGAGSVGLGFAIPSNQARRVAEQLIANGKATVPAIGAQLDSSYTGRGVRIADSSQLPNGQVGIVPGSPAAKAGLKEGDIIVAIDGTTVANADSAIVLIRAQAPGDTMTFTLDRGGKDVNVKVTLGTLSSLDYGNTGTTGGTTGGLPGGGSQ